MDKYLKEAIKRVGSKSAVARHFGISRQAVTLWKRCPPEHVLKLESISGVSRHDLRPDIFGEAEETTDNMLLKEQAS